MTVISALTSFQHARVANFCDRRCQVLLVLNRHKRCRLKPGITQEGLFPDPVLGSVEQVGTLGNIRLIGHITEGVQVDVLKLIGEDV